MHKVVKPVILYKFIDLSIFECYYIVKKLNEAAVSIRHKPKSEMEADASANAGSHGLGLSIPDRTIHYGDRRAALNGLIYTTAVAILSKSPEYLSPYELITTLYPNPDKEPDSAANMARIGITAFRKVLREDLQAPVKVESRMHLGVRAVSDQSQHLASGDVLSFNGVTLDVGFHRLQYGASTIGLRPGLCLLAKALFTKPNQIVPLRKLIHSVSASPGARTVRETIASELTNLRHKFNDLSAPVHLKSHFGEGYELKALLPQPFAPATERLSAKGTAMTDWNQVVANFATRKKARDNAAARGVELVPNGFLLRCNGQELALSKMAFQLSMAIFATAPHFVSKEDVIYRMWDDNSPDNAPRTIDVHLCKLKKLYASIGAPIVFEAKAGCGIRVHGKGETIPLTSQTLKVGDVSLDPLQRLLCFKDRQTILEGQTTVLGACMFKHKTRAVPAKRLLFMLQDSSKSDEPITRNNVSVQACRFRDKLAEVGADLTVKASRSEYSLVSTQLESLLPTPQAFGQARYG